ncbi:MAG TPA: hypothetical protein VGU22_06950 [Methylomirabilota bacterium]|nr:hypothetical protein [Methylomirabilota bacterium]
MQIMIEALVVIVLLGSLTLGPLALRILAERRADRALRLRAIIHAAAVRELHGDSFLAVHVTPPTLWRAGRVSLSTPADWACLVERVWPHVLALVPAEYELVVKEARRAEPAPAVGHPALGRAA